MQGRLSVVAAHLGLALHAHDVRRCGPAVRVHHKGGVGRHTHYWLRDLWVPCRCHLPGCLS